LDREFAPVWWGAIVGDSIVSIHQTWENHGLVDFNSGRQVFGAV